MAPAPVNLFFFIKLLSRRYFIRVVQNELIELEGSELFLAGKTGARPCWRLCICAGFHEIWFCGEGWKKGSRLWLV